MRVRAAILGLVLGTCALGHVPSAMAQEPAAPAQPRAADPLTLPEVLDSVAGSHPQLEAARLRLRAAEADLSAARGGFDPLLRVGGKYTPIGSYTNGRVDVELRQPTPFWGLSVYGGWRLGLGDFLPYDLRAKTASGGEVRAGVTLPVWQGGPTDRRRADIRIAGLAQDLAGIEAEARTIELERAAARAYWAWVGAGLRLVVQHDLLALAEDRDAALRRQIAAGHTPDIEGVDNRRAIVERRARIVAAERGLQQAAIELGRSLRDEAGVMIVPAADRLPRAFPEPSKPERDRLDGLLAEALQRRPELRRLALQRKMAQVELQLARNLRSPRVDLDAQIARDLGKVKPGDAYLLPTEFTAGVMIEVPLALRTARGKLRKVEADLARIDQELRFARDTVTAELRDAHSALVAAYERVGLAREQLTLTHTLEQAERSRFNLGDSTLLLVNLREQATTDAATQELDALAEYHRAAADLRAALGLQAGAQ